MNAKTLNILAIVALVLVVATLWEASRSPAVEFEFNAGQLLVPDLDPGRVDQVVVKKGDDEVTLQRSGRSFRVASLNNYQASNKEVNSLLSQVTDIRCAAKVSDSDGAFADLGVAEDSEGATFARFLDADGNEILAVVVSESKEGVQHVRLAGSPTVFRTEGYVSLRTRGLDFIDKQLLNLQRDDIASVQVTPAASRPYTIENGDDGVKLVDVPDGMKVKGTEPDGVLGAVTYLSFTDLKPAADVSELEFASRFVATTDAGAEYSFELAHDEEADKWYLRGKARYTGPDINTLTVTRGAEGEEADAEIEKNKAWLDAAKATDQFAQKHQGWVYEVGSWKAKSMTKAFDELVEADDGKPDKVAASHILIPWAGADRADAEITRTKEEARTLAEDLLAQVKADPSKFEDLARENSSCPSAEKGGDLGEFAFESMAQPFSETSFNLEVGQIADEITETGFGFHVIKRTK